MRSASAIAGEPCKTSFEGNQITVEGVTEGARAEITFTTNFPRYCMMGADYYEAK